MGADSYLEKRKEGTEKEPTTRRGSKSGTETHA
jgi:hypothetical protein